MLLIRGVPAVLPLLIAHDPYGGEPAKKVFLALLACGLLLVPVVLLVAAIALRSRSKSAARVCLLLLAATLVVPMCSVWLGREPMLQAHRRWKADVAKDPESLRSPFNLLERAEDHDLKLLARTTRLKRLELEASLSQGDQLRYLAVLKQLQSLSVARNACLQDAHLQHVEGMTQLQELDLSYCYVTDAGLQHLKGMTQLQVLRLEDQRITDAGLECLGGMSELRELDLKQTKVTDAGMSRVAQLGRLQKLELEETGVTDRGLEQIERLTQLQSLGLSGTRITDAGLQHLATMSQLQRLDMRKTAVTDAGLKHLVRMAQLRELYLEHTPLTDAGLQHLAALSQLQKLDISDTAVTDAGLAHLRGATQLTSLNLNSTKLTDAAVPHLQGLSRLESLGLGNTGVTLGAREKLRRALPKCRITEWWTPKDRGAGRAARSSVPPWVPYSPAGLATTNGDSPSRARAAGRLPARIVRTNNPIASRQKEGRVTISAIRGGTKASDRKP